MCKEQGGGEPVAVLFFSEILEAREELRYVSAFRLVL